MPPTQSSSRFVVWVLDLVGYDARGGQARVFSTLERAKAAEPHVEWVETSDGWEQKLPLGSLADLWVINECLVDAPEETP